MLRDRLNGDGQVHDRGDDACPGRPVNNQARGAAGIPALGEPQATMAGRIITGLPDFLGADRARFAGRRVLVVGAEHSAATSLLALAELRRHAAATEIVWAVRAAVPRPLVGESQDDELPATASSPPSLRPWSGTAPSRLPLAFVAAASPRFPTAGWRSAGWSTATQSGSRPIWSSPPPASVPTLVSA